jgi:hypothetical protein
VLHDFQRALAGAIVAAPASVRVPPGAYAGSAERRALGLGVYRNNAAHARVETLTACYPAVRQLLGEACFTTLALDMAARAPVAVADPVAWSRQLPAFIATTPLAAELPYLADVARIEAAIVDAASAADATPPDPALLADAERLACCTIGLASGTAVLRSEWPALAIWQAQRDGSDTIGDVADCVVFRDGLAVEAVALSRTDADALALLASRCPAADWFGRVTPDFTDLAGRLIAAGAIILDEGDPT